jgi:prepilin peptidase CpaA
MLLTAIVIAGSVIATVVDIRERRVPNVLTMTMAAVGLVLAMAGIGSASVGASLAGLGLGLVLLLPAHMLGAMGAGDVKLLAAFGALLGPAGIFAAFLRAGIAGGAIALVVAMSRGRFLQTLERTALLVTIRRQAVALVEDPTANNRFPYAPAIAIGATMAVLGW